MAESPAPAASPSGATKELRLALVCYGGSSLAIYMHGITKEIHRLVKASALLDALPAKGSGSASEDVYRELLAELAERHPEHLRTRVVVDVVAGTSAGGINGVYLAKALAHNRSQDSLRDLWFERGDIDELLNAPRRLPRVLRFAWVALGALWRSPLRGDEMARWLFDALAGMDEAGSTPATVTTLMPHGHDLELFVTVTDFYGYDRQVPIERPPLVHEARHRHVLGFGYEEGLQDDFSEHGNGALAFAARTTSCFPGVFPPVSLARFARYLAARNADLSGLERQLFRSYELAGAIPGDTWFVDGGVLDNKPFGHAIEAIRRRPAGREVDRRLLYLEPSPGLSGRAAQALPAPLPAPGAPKPAEAHPAPGTVSALLGAVSGLPRAEPILDDLLEVAALNERVQRIADIVETSFERIGRLVEETTGDELDVPPDPASPRLGEWAQALHRAAVERAGFGYATYIRLKISGVVDRYADAVATACEFPADSNHAMLVRAVLRCWAEEAGLFDRRAEPSQEQTEFLRSFDLGYGERRLRFVIAGLIGWYDRVSEPGYPSRAELDLGKAILYRSIETLEASMSGRDFDPELAGSIRRSFTDAALADFLRDHGLDGQLFVGEHRVALDRVAATLRDSLERRLSGFTPALYRDLYELTRSWDPARRRDLLVRYLGFPFWDVLLYPVQALSDVGEQDQVEVVRMSPADARLLRARPGERKVKGVALHHFGAFFSRPDRENDYLWGRLDAAEHLVRILVGDEGPAFESWSRRAFAAILDEEDVAVPHVRPLVDHLRGQLHTG
jgi:patatin-related protein